MPAHHDQAYEPPRQPSSETVSLRLWRLALGLLLLTLAGGAALAVLLALGAADPPRAGPVAWEALRLARLEPDRPWRDLPRFRASAPLPGLPITLEARAAADAPWGLWLDTAGGVFAFLVGHEQYTSAGSDLAWRGFIHMQPRVNTLYLHIETDGAATFRVNNEIAWRGPLDRPAAWGLVVGDPAAFDLLGVRLYAP